MSAESRSARNGVTLLEPDDLEPAVFGLRNKMKELATVRQKGASILKTSQWALYHRSELRNLIDGITSLFDSIEKSFPAPEAQPALVREEIAQIRNIQALKLVEHSALGVDNLLSAAAKEALTGHRYLKVDVKGKAQVEDTFSEDWRFRGHGLSHVYNGVAVDQAGIASVGNKYGGKDFWDE